VRAGLRVGNELYRANLFGIRNPELKDQKEQQEQESQNYSYFDKLGNGDQNGAKLQTTREALQRAQQRKTELVNKTGQDNYSRIRNTNTDGSNSERYNREVGKVDKSIEELSKKIEDLTTKGLKIQNKEDQQDGQSQVEQLVQALSQAESPTINIEISIKDADKVPQALNEQLLAPLRAQLEELRNSLRLSPTPPTV